MSDKISLPDGKTISTYPKPIRILWWTALSFLAITVFAYGTYKAFGARAEYVKAELSRKKSSRELDEYTQELSRRQDKIGNNIDAANTSGWQALREGRFVDAERFATTSICLRENVSARVCRAIARIQRFPDDLSDVQKDADVAFNNLKKNDMHVEEDVLVELYRLLGNIQMTLADRVSRASDFGEACRRYSTAIGHFNQALSMRPDFDNLQELRDVAQARLSQIEGL